jgi:hypothetical protein
LRLAAAHVRAKIVAVAVRVLAVGLFLGVLVTVYLTARQTSVPAQVHSPAIEQSSEQAAASSEPFASVPTDELASGGATEPTIAERSATVKRMISDELADRYRDQFVETLVAKGLALSDSASIVQNLLDGLADCHFDATRRQYEAYGVRLEEFVRGAEEVWSNTPPDSRGVSIEVIATYAPQCVANVSQQAGIPVAVNASSVTSTAAPSDFGIWSQPNLVAQHDGAMTEMEATILAHIALFPNVALTALRIKCEEKGCIVLMQGQKIDIFQFEFDRFAETNGFASATLWGDASRRVVMLSYER